MNLIQNICTEPDFTDMFCGAGGSSIGLTKAGLILKTALNHWDRAIETHAYNFPDAEHLCEDVNRYDLRRLPRTAVLWGSPICTEISPAGGKKKTRGQTDLLEELGHVPKEGFERTRATFWDVIRAVEIHRYKIVLIENVVNVATDWELFDVWLAGMAKLGYEYQYVSVSSAHIGDEGNLPAPQWRDRLYIVFNLKGVPKPDVDPRPLAWCFACEEITPARQSWKRPGARRIGKYGQQYSYVCANTKCRHAAVEPFVLPAAAAIDWSDPGTRIGDRKRSEAKPEGLAPATIRRIRAGLEEFGGAMLAPAGGTWNDSASSVDNPMRTRTTRETEGLAIPPFMMSVNHDGDGRRYLPNDRPLPSRTTKIGDGLVIPSIVGELRRNSNARLAGQDSLNTVTAGGNHHWVATPGAFISKHHGGLDYKRIEHMNKSVHDPLGTVVARPNISLVIPYRRGSTAYPAGDSPLSTVATHEQHGVARPAVELEDCYFRMLKAREHLRAQRFHDTYVVLGNSSEQTMQAGNAVSTNVAQWLGTASMKAHS
jgi:DNA (cytosine-5)-methyltransferase 1